MCLWSACLGKGSEPRGAPYCGGWRKREARPLDQGSDLTLECEGGSLWCDGPGKGKSQHAEWIVRATVEAGSPPRDKKAGHCRSEGLAQLLLQRNRHMGHCSSPPTPPVGRLQETPRGTQGAANSLPLWLKVKVWLFRPAESFSSHSFFPPFGFLCFQEMSDVMALVWRSQKMDSMAFSPQPPPHPPLPPYLPSQG